MPFVTKRSPIFNRPWQSRTRRCSLFSLLIFGIGMRWTFTFFIALSFSPCAIRCIELLENLIARDSFRGERCEPGILGGLLSKLSTRLMFSGVRIVLELLFLGKPLKFALAGHFLVVVRCCRFVLGFACKHRLLMFDSSFEPLEIRSHYESSKFADSPIQCSLACEFQPDLLMLISFQ